MAAEQQQEEWVDAGPFLAAVCGGMAVGELLHGDSFSLFDSTTAIEIGDVKMDIGLNRGQELGSPEELIASGAAPTSLPPALLLAVLDRLLVLEATWHTGSMLPQTVFTSLYTLQPERLAPNAPLHSFCLAVRSTCSLFVDMAHAGAVTEDEDLFVHTFGLKLLDPPGDKALKAALQALATAEEELEQRVAGGSSSSAAPASGSGAAGSGGSKGGGKGGGKSGASQQQQAQAQAAATEDAVAAAVLARIRFRRLVLEALQSLQQYSQAGVEQARRQCQLAEAQLQLVAGSAGLAAPLEEAPGFVPDINRRHMGLVPPRPVRPVAFEAAVEHWRGLLRGLASSLQSLLSVRGSWGALKATLVDFAARGHHAIVRSAMHMQLIKPLPPPPPPEGAEASASKLLNGSSSGAAGGGGGKRGGAAGGSGGGKKGPGEVPPWCPGLQMACREFGLSLAGLPCPEAATFVEQAAIAMQGQAYALCLNRCRQRRRLRRQLEDWRNIFDHGFNADVAEPWQRSLAGAGWQWDYAREGLLEGQGPGATWAEREGAACALLHLQLGFPLDLYAPFEHLQVYWYSSFLLDHQKQLTAMLHAGGPRPAQQPAAAAAKRAGASGGKQRGGGAQAAGGAQRGRAEEQAAGKELEVLQLDVERLMCQAMFYCAIALDQLGMVPAPDTPFNSEEQRYEQRFGCMATLYRPEPLSFGHFKAATDGSALPPARVLGLAANAFQQAAERTGTMLAAPLLRGLLREEQVRHLEGVQRIATQNAVATKLLAATSVKAAAAAAAAAAAGEGAEGGPAAKAAAPSFKPSFDFKTALACSTQQFYPCIVLRH